MANKCTLDAGKIIGAAKNRGSKTEFDNDQRRAEEFDTALNQIIAEKDAADRQGLKKDIAEDIFKLANEEMIKRTNAYVSVQNWKQVALGIADKHLKQDYKRRLEDWKKKGSDPNKKPENVYGIDSGFKHVPESALKEIREMLATVVGGNINQPGRTVAPIPGIHQMSAQISDDIILKSNTQMWVRDATVGVFGGVRGWVSKRNDMDRLKALFGGEHSKNIGKDIQDQAKTLNALADASSHVRSRLLGHSSGSALQNNVLRQLPMEFTDLQVMGRAKFIELAASGNYRLGSGESDLKLDVELAENYYDHLQNDKSAGDTAITDLTSKRIYAATPESHYDYIKAAGARSFTDTVMNDVARLGIQEASVRALGTTPGSFIDNLIQIDRTAIMKKVFSDANFRTTLQNALNRATGQTDAIGFQSWFAKAGYGALGISRTIGHSLVLKDAALSVIADLPIRAPINSAIRFNGKMPTIIQVAIDGAGQLLETLRTPGMSRDVAAMHGQILEAEWQTVIGSGQYIESARGLHKFPRGAQRFAGAFHTLSFFRSANIGAQTRSNGEFLLKMRAAVKKSIGKDGNRNWDNLPKRVQNFLNDNYLIDKHIFNEIAGVANLENGGDISKIFNFENMNPYVKTRLQVGMRQNLHQSTGRANPFQIAGNIFGELLTAQRGTAKRELVDLTVPFISPLQNQINIIQGLWANSTRKTRGSIVIQSAAAYVTYGAARVVYSDYANGKDTDWSDPYTWFKVATYGLVPMLGFFYGGVSKEFHGFHGSDVAAGFAWDVIRSLVHLVSEKGEVDEDELRNWLKGVTPSMYKILLDEMKVIDKEKS